MENFKDTTIVEIFVNHLKKNGHLYLKIDRIPDKEIKGGNKKEDIDAIAGNFAIEHTRFDTVKNQTFDSVNFLKVVKDFETKISSQLNFRLKIILPYKGIRKGQKWTSISDSLKNWIINFSSKLTAGEHFINNIPGIPFQLQVNKTSDRKPGLIFSRSEPENNDFVSRLKGHLNRKGRKLIPYKVEGFQTILLIESNDIALMNEDKMLEGIRVAFSQKLPDGVDEIWYSDTSVPEEILFHNFTDSIGS